MSDAWKEHRDEAWGGECDIPFACLTGDCPHDRIDLCFRAIFDLGWNAHEECLHLNPRVDALLEALEKIAGKYSGDPVKAGDALLNNQDFAFLVLRAFFNAPNQALEEGAGR